MCVFSIIVEGKRQNGTCEIIATVKKKNPSVSFSFPLMSEFAEVLPLGSKK